MSDLVSSRRRRAAWSEMWDHRTLLGPGKNADKLCWRHLGTAAVALYRKATVNQPVWLEKLCLGRFDTVILITTYLTLNLGLLFGRQTDPVRVHGGRRTSDGPCQDWIAHHGAMLCFANLPLVIGLSAKNSVITLITGIPCVWFTP